MSLKKQCFATFFAVCALFSCFTPAIAFSLEQQQFESLSNRAFNAKPNDVKKMQMLENKENKKTPAASSYGISGVPSYGPPSRIGPGPMLKQKIQKKEGFQWGNLLPMAFKLISGTKSTAGTSIPLNKLDQVQDSAEFSWTKIVSLGLQLVLSFFGNDNVAIDKMDPGSPIEAFLTAIIAYFTGSNNPQEVSVMAKQATELWGIVISLLDALRTSFSQRSFSARAIGSNDIMADAAIASTAVLKSYIQSYNTEDDLCVQKYICEANRDCADETSESGYLFCQMATYAFSYMLETKTYTPFEIINDAGRRGRIGENCETLFAECKAAKYF